MQFSLDFTHKKRPEISGPFKNLKKKLFDNP